MTKQTVYCDKCGSEGEMKSGFYPSGWHLVSNAPTVNYQATRERHLCPRCSGDLLIVAGGNLRLKGNKNEQRNRGTD